MESPCGFQVVEAVAKRQTRGRQGWQVHTLALKSTKDANLPVEKPAILA
jgi:hypothetical protein